jgi:transcriptional regulator with XRE-family HTH domain
MNNKQIGDRLRYYRHKKGLTQQNLADKVGVTWEMISRYERGESSAITQIEGLSKALDISPAEFIVAGYSINDKLPTNQGIIPLLSNSERLNTISKPIEFEKALKENFSYYNAPSWILAKFPEAFAIEAGAIKSNTITTKDRGVWYFARHSKVQESDLSDKVILQVTKHGLVIEVYNKQIAQDSILGILIAQEERFV